MKHPTPRRPTPHRFELVLRNVQASGAGSAAEAEAAVSAAAEALRRSGFINYYGLQRFGSGAVPTHRCGGAGEAQAC